LVAKAFSGGKPAQSKTGKTMAPPAPAIELIKPAIKATIIKPIESVIDKSIHFSFFCESNMSLKQQFIKYFLMINI
jgi:hypothetical protein